MCTCELCGARISEHKTFCGSCDKKVNSNISSQTTVHNADAEAPATSKAEHATVPLSASSEAPKGFTGTDHATVPIVTEPKTYHTVPIHVVEKEDEEERRRRIAMLDPEFSSPNEEHLSKNAIPLPSVADLTTHENIPLVADSPQTNGVQGTPQLRGDIAIQGTTPQPYSPFGPQSGISQKAGSMANRRLSAQYAWFPPAASHAPSMPFAPQHSPGEQASNQPQRWLKAGLIAGLVLSILIFSGMGISLMISTPTLTLTGGTNVAQGSTLHLSGNHFLPNSTITLTLDHTTPIYYSYQQSPYPARRETTSKYNNLENALILANDIPQNLFHDDKIKVGSNGTFDITIQVGTDWTVGQHTIQAIESPGSRSATVSFTVIQQTPIFTQGTVTPTSTSTTTPDAPTSVPTVGITPTTIIASSLSGVTPNTLTLGPSNAGDQQATSSIVTLNTTGTALFAWNAAWDQQQAPWLQLTPASGKLQAPASQKITVSAQSANLKAGTYKALITFTSSLDAHTVLLTVALTVQAGCLKVTSASLNFVGTVGANDPAPQTVILNNCGLAGPWTATTKADGNWLSVKPTSGTIDQNGTQDVIVAATSQKLAAGTYQGLILFSSGGNQVTVSVTLTVQSPPQLNVSQQQIAVAQACKSNAGTWTCNETLSGSGTQGDLAWTSSNSGNGGVTITPASGTIAAGQTTQVTVVIPVASCAANFTLTFAGPVNSVVVPVDCGGTQQTT
jgi:hypothetical protein